MPACDAVLPRVCILLDNYWQIAKLPTFMDLHMDRLGRILPVVRGS